MGRLGKTTHFIKIGVVFIAAEGGEKLWLWLEHAAEKCSQIVRL